MMKDKNCILRYGIGKKIYFPLFFLTLFCSCTVTNNLYVNDPVPIGKNKGNYYGGFGMGLEPRIDSILLDGEVFSNSLNRSFNLCFGGQYGFTDKFSVGGRIHLPKIIGGFGMNIRPQLSLFPKNTIFGMAISGDIGFVVPKDSIKILGSSTELENETQGAFNADLSIPMSIRLGNDIRFIVTPRWSYNLMFLRKNFESTKNKKLKVNYPCLSVGFRLKRVYLESSLINWDNNQMFVFGIAYFFNHNKE